MITHMTTDSRLRRRVLAGAVLTIALAASPHVATAATTVRLDGNDMVVEGDSTDNDFEIRQVTSVLKRPRPRVESWIVTDNRSGAVVVAGEYCTQQGVAQVSCPVGYGRGLVAKGNAGNDRIVSYVTATPLYEPVAPTAEVVGGEGDDRLENQSPGMLTLWGEQGNDTLIGGVTGDTLYGDRQFAYPHTDLWVGDDVIDATQTISGWDVVNCGRGQDTAYVNPADYVDPGLDLGCESVTVS